MSAKKTISNTFTVNTVEDGESAPYYFQEWFAWSNDSTTASVTTAPNINGSWATSIPTQGNYAYLWRKSIRYVWNDNTRQYTAETPQYFRMSGTNGTSINPKGTVDFAYSTKSGFPPASSSLYGKTAVAKGSKKIYKCDIPSPGYYDWLETGSTASAGDSYTVDAGNLNGSYQSTNNMHGHFIMWSSEANQWIDLGQFQGQSGKTYYTHIAWATNVTISGGVVTSVEGFTTDKSPNDTTHLWMGVLVNESSGADPSDATLYTWSYTKGVDGTIYDISFEEAWCRVDNAKDITARLVGYAYRISGETRSIMPNATIWYGYKPDDSSTFAGTTTNNNGKFDVGDWFDGDNVDEYAKGSNQIFAAIVVNGNMVCTKYVTMAYDGQTGQRGKIGRFFYFGGVWENIASTDSFVLNDAQAPYFEHTDSGQKRFHVYNPATNPPSGTISKAVMAQTSWGNKPWESMTNDFKYIITEAIFAKFAHLGSFIISGDYFISQYGTLFYNNNGTIETTVINASNVSKLFGDSVAYAWFADSDPMVDTMPTTGNYKFRPTKCIDALSGEEWMAGGNMHVSQRGDLTVKGATMIDSVATFNDPAFYIDSMQARELYYDVFNVTKGAKYYNGDSVYSGGYYGIGDIRIKANRFFLYSEGNQNRSGISGVSQLHIILPPAHLFVGQSLVIVNETYGFADREVTLEQEYIHGDGVNGICLVDKTLLKVSPDYPYGSGIGLIDGAPYATDGYNPKTGKSYSQYLSNGIWHLYESQQTGHKDYTISNEVEVGGYSWFEVTAVIGEIVTDWNSVSPEIARTYNAVWMLTRWEKKQ